MFDSVIAKEGQKSVLVAFIAMLVFILAGCGLLSFISFALTIIFIFVYRNNALKVNSSSENIVAPISGKVTAIDVKDGNRLVHIDVNLCDSHILRALEDGSFTVSNKRGLNLCLSTFKAKTLNERAILQFDNSSLELISSTFNPSFDILGKENVQKADRLGVFLQGQVIITLDSNFELLVKIGDKVESGISEIAKKIVIEEEKEEQV